jgi:hypothetical protein
MEFDVLHVEPQDEFRSIPFKPVIVRSKLLIEPLIAVLTAIVTEMILHSPGKQVDWPILRIGKKGRFVDFGTSTCVV